MPAADILVNSLAGGLAGTLMEVIFYSVDSFKIQQQSGEKLSMHRLYRGALPIAFCGSFPSLAVFFACFTPLKEYANKDQEEFNGAGVFAASLIAAVPSSLVAIPSDVLKKRLVLGIDSNISLAFRNVVKNGGMRGLFLGWQTNLVKDIPFAGLKISLYENIKSQYLVYADKEDATPLESACVGLTAGTITSVLTCPIDCVNTRIKSGELAEFSVIGAHKEIIQRNGFKALFRGLLPRTFILSLGSSVFWFWYIKLQDGLNSVLLLNSSTIA
jgi:solute carrier family 25 (mitochondrial S-adenosylmethionine transporter), member 26